MDFESGNPFRRAKNIVPILTPPFHGVFERADDLAVALRALVYARGAKRTHLHEPRMTREDYWVLATVLRFAILEMKI
jgi:energy-coupling factor transport system permease protein